MGAAPGSSDLGAWIRRLRAPGATAPPGGEPESDVDDTAVGWAAEHARRYVATGGADDGWDGPRPIVLLYTTGRRSGRRRRNPVLCFEGSEDRADRYVIASYGGAPEHPAWYRNLVADPRVEVRFLTEHYAAVAVTLDDAERALLWPRIVERYPMFAEYQRGTDRLIPVVRLVPT